MISCRVTVLWEERGSLSCKIEMMGRRWQSWKLLCGPVGGCSVCFLLQKLSLRETAAQSRHRRLGTTRGSLASFLLSFSPDFWKVNKRWYEARKTRWWLENGWSEGDWIGGFQTLIAGTITPVNVADIWTPGSHCAQIANSPKVQMIQMLQNLEHDFIQKWILQTSSSWE